MEYIKNLLANLDKIEPIETGVSPKFKKEHNIKAIIFDIYGTLLISSSGDIEQAEISENNLKEALDAADIKIVEQHGNPLSHILHDFEYTIKVSHEASRKNHIPYPEIDILSIWDIVLIHARRKGLIDFDDEVNIMRMTCVFEFLSNKVYPMPGLKETISALKAKGLPLGIVSNAQFYTPVVMNYFLNNDFKLNETIDRFEKDLTVYSYKLGKGKPDTKLFEELVPSLKSKYNLQPEEVLFVGNDMLKDIYTSNTVGFKTVLFAGDKRSLRMREDDERVKPIKADHTITDLKQLLEIVDA